VSTGAGPGATGNGRADDHGLLRIADGSLAAEVLPGIGARLHRLRAFGHDLLRTPHDLRPYDDDPYFYGSYPMAPWCNRVAAGPGVVAGRAIDLPVTFPDGTAIHGQVSRRSWEVVDAGAAHATLRIDAGGDGWPWPYTVEERIAIAGDTLRLGLRLTNRSDGPMPGGLGFHPWFLRPIRVAIAASTVHPSNLATAPEPVAVSGLLDRRRLEALPDGLDATWADLADPPAILDWPDVGIRATMTVAAVPPGRFVVAASFAGMDAIAVEPQTHAPDGLRRLERGEPGGLALVPPGGTLELDVGLAFERTAPAPEGARQT
jgi:aldose 1-epimerase